MNHRAVAYRHVVADVQGFVGIGVKDGAILDVDPLADADGGDIASDDYVVHDRAPVADLDVAADIGCGRDEDVTAEFGGWKT